jgi:hypothetical protein
MWLDLLGPVVGNIRLVGCEAGNTPYELGNLAFCCSPVRNILGYLGAQMGGSMNPNGIEDINDLTERRRILFQQSRKLYR